MAQICNLLVQKARHDEHKRLSRSQYIPGRLASYTAGHHCSTNIRICHSRSLQPDLLTFISTKRFTLCPHQAGSSRLSLSILAFQLTLYQLGSRRKSQLTKLYVITLSACIGPLCRECTVARQAGRPQPGRAYRPNVRKDILDWGDYHRRDQYFCVTSAWCTPLPNKTKPAPVSSYSLLTDLFLEVKTQSVSMLITI